MEEQYPSTMTSLRKPEIDPAQKKLFLAAKTGNLSLWNEALGEGALPHIYNRHGASVLHVAAYYGQEKIVQELLLRRTSHGDIAINASDKDGCIPLHWAIYGKHAVIVKLLLRAGADMLHQDARGRNGWDYQPNAYKDYHKDYVQQQFFLSIQTGNIAAIQHYLLREASLVEKNEEGLNALHLAIRSQHPDWLWLFFNIRPQFCFRLYDGTDPASRSAWQQALYANYPEAAALLVWQGADAYSGSFTYETTKASVNIATWRSYQHYLQSSLNAAAYPQEAPYETQRFFHLVRAGANLQQQAHDGLTPLHHLVRNDHKELLANLLKEHFYLDLNLIFDQHGQTPLHTAFLSQHPVTAALLVAYGAKAGIPDHNHICVYHTHMNPYAMSIYHQTLHYFLAQAITAGNLFHCVTLLEGGANPHAIYGKYDALTHAKALRRCETDPEKRYARQLIVDCLNHNNMSTLLPFTEERLRFSIAPLTYQHAVTSSSPSPHQTTPTQ